MTKIELTLQTQKQLKKLGVGIVYLFGSQAEGTSHPLSDIDIGIVFADKTMVRKVKERPLKMGAQFDLLFEKALNEPKIQTTFLQTTPLVLQMNAISSGKVIFETNPEFRADYQEYVMLRYADFEPLYSEFYKERIGVKYV